MIVVDTSALMAIALEEPAAEECSNVLYHCDEILISSGTLAEALIVSARRRVRNVVERLVEGFSFTVVDMSPMSARRVADAYERWGKGIHPAALNMGDCYAYELAKLHGCPLLFVGQDFSRTDISSALALTPPPAG